MLAYALSRSALLLSVLPRTTALASMSQSPAPEFGVAYVTVPSQAAGKDLAAKLVTAHLAACVNIVPSVYSVYEWEGKVEQEEEAMLIIKTRLSRLAELSAFVKDNHPYDVPEVIAMPIVGGHEPYLDWLDKNVPAKQ